MYEFNNIRPPLLKDYGGDVLSISENFLTKELGTVSFVEEYPFTLPIDFATNIRCHFAVSRRKFWRISEAPNRYAVDLARTIVTTKGFTKTEREIIQKNSKIDVGAAYYGLSLNVAKELNATKETTFEWREEYSETHNQTFFANNTYCTWQLIDRIEVIRVDHAKDGTLYMGTFNGSISCITSVYQDSATDLDLIGTSAATFSYQIAANRIS